MALTDSLISYWALDESSGDAADSHGSNTLTNNNTTPFVAAKINNGADIEQSSSQSFSITDAAQTGLDFNSDWSVSAWIKAESFTAGGNYAIIGKDGATRGYFFLVNDNDGTGDARKLIAGFGDSGAITQGRGSTQLSTGTWYHCVLTSDISAANLTFYLNNVVETTAYTNQTATSIANTANAFRLGASFGATSNLFDGIIDEVGIWGRVLTSAEVTSLYNGGSGLAYPLTESGGGVVLPHPTLLTLGVG